MNEMKSTVGIDEDGIKITEYLRNKMKLSATLVKKVKFGGVYINGINVHMRAIVRTGDEVWVRLPTEESSGIKKIPMLLDIIYEDDYLIALNKPIGMPTHPSRGNSLPTLAEGLMAYFGDESFVFRSINRLDRDTSGIVIVAKDAFMADRLSAEMKAGGYVKKYSAVVRGVPNPPEGLIDAPIEREAEGSIKRAVRQDGKRALTEYRLITTYPDGNSLVEITLYTGRTHQIRVHMAYIGNPLVGDFLYGERGGHESYYLHAKSIELTHPISGERMELISKEEFRYEEKIQGNN